MGLAKEYFDEQINSLNKRLDTLPTQDNILALQSDIDGLQDEIRTVKTTLNQINQTLTSLDKRDKEDSNAFAKTLINHDQRINEVENDMKQLKLKPVS